ncbi:phosphoglycerate mutase [Enterococcus saigonensis]|uniref:Phosphoglycerate mutase n=1 Tax=Enterococcus saigonensis TaxID=1805431 RepID=A0A679I9S8_9ENTE|nr:histidine phosphatase family protein [Enterococcus saigonensis]BCA86408.1 phosphoglycerate mutase [Enterococcus saigonensis]
MELYFTRHGKTEWNNERRFQGAKGDSPLLAESLAEIKLLGGHLKDIPFEKIYASTAPRAMKTAQGIAAELNYQPEIIYNDGLKELGLGDLEGQLIDEMAIRYPRELHNLRYHLDHYDPSIFKGEKIEDALARIETVVCDAVIQNKGPLLFVGHGASLTAAIQWLAGKQLGQLREMGGLVNNSLSIMTTKEPKNLMPFKLTKWNDASFLGNQSSLDALL